MVVYWYGTISRFPQGQLVKPEGYGQTRPVLKHNKSQQTRNRLHIILGIHSPLYLLTDGNCDKVESPGCGLIDSKLFNLQQSSAQYDVSHTTARRQTITWFNAQDLWLYIFSRRLGGHSGCENHTLSQYSVTVEMMKCIDEIYIYSTRSRDTFNVRIQSHNTIDAITILST